MLEAFIGQTIAKHGMELCLRHLGPAGTLTRPPASSVTTTVAVMPALSVMPSGTLSIAMRTGMRCASRTQLKVGLTLATRSVLTTLSRYQLA